MGAAAPETDQLVADLQTHAKSVGVRIGQAARWSAAEGLSRSAMRFQLVKMRLASLEWILCNAEGTSDPPGPA